MTDLKAVEEPQDQSALEKTKQEYIQKCVELGNVMYQIEVNRLEVPKLIEEMKKLNNKGHYLEGQIKAQAEAQKELDNGSKH
jgi:ribosomal protein S6